MAVIAANENVNEISKTVVKYNSLLNSSRYFHFAENLNFDALHDFLEGIGSFSIKIFLYALAIYHPEFRVDASCLNEKKLRLGWLGLTFTFKILLYPLQIIYNW